MANGEYLEGLREVEANLRKAILEIATRTKVGLLRAGELMKGDAQKDTPVDTGALRQSAYTADEETSQGPVVEVGFTVSYAPFVHENLEARHTVGGPKFLENAIKNNFDRVLRIIHEHAKVD